MTLRNELFRPPTRQRFTVQGAGTIQKKSVPVGTWTHRRIIASVLCESLSNSPQVQILECESILLLEDEGSTS
jgi:hypothetical protein